MALTPSYTESIREIRSTPMFAKLLTIILAAGAVGLGLLVLRQQRIDTVHEIAEVHQQLVNHDKQLWSMHHELAEKCRVARIRQLMQQLENNWAPIPSGPGIVPRPPAPSPLYMPHNVAQWADARPDEQLGG